MGRRQGLRSKNGGKHFIAYLVSQLTEMSECRVKFKLFACMRSLPARRRRKKSFLREQFKIEQRLTFFPGFPSINRLIVFNCWRLLILSVREKVCV